MLQWLSLKRIEKQHICDRCFSMLKSWTDALNRYAYLVDDLKNAGSNDYSRLYDEAASALELEAGAKAIYDQHREEHAFNEGLGFSK